MLSFIVRRTLLGVTSLIFISMVSFVIVQLPEGDYIDAWLSALEGQGGYAYDIMIPPEEVQRLRELHGLDKPVHIQYLKWVWNVMRADLGISLDLNLPITTIIGERLPLTIILALFTVVFTWLLAIPIGVYSALRQHSVGDYTFTFVGFMGLAVPDFLLALVLMYLGFQYFGLNIGGLFSSEYIEAPWSLARLADLLKHLPVPAFVLGTSGTAALIRIMRANVLDEIHKPYVVTARAKGMAEWKAVIKYPVRVALNPFISTIGYVLPYLLSGSVIVSVVLSLPTVGPLLLRGLLQQDMYMAGSIVVMLGAMTVIGTLLSDILLVITDPRIRLEG